MAKNDKNVVKISPRARKLADKIQSNMDTLYKSTYFNSPRGNKDINNLTLAMNRSIDKIINNNTTNTGISNISKLYNRIMDTQSDKKIISDIEDVFSDDALMSAVMDSYNENKYLRDLDKEIDTVCKYMPKLLEALDTKKDNVLSADSFSKDFINIVDTANTTDLTIFTDRIDKLKDLYDLQIFAEDVYDNTAKYGETFIYLVPYKKAIAKLLANKAGVIVGNMNMEQGQIITEGAKPFIFDGQANQFNKDHIDLKIEINKSNVLESVIRAYQMADKKLSTISEAAINNYKIEKSDRFSHTIDDDLTFDKIKDDIATDGLTTAVDDKKKLEKKLRVPGCVMRRLDRASVIPIYIEDMCLGYYYFEFTNFDDSFDSNSGSGNSGVSDPLASLKANATAASQTSDEDRAAMLKYVSGQISRYIDVNFVNNNQDLRKEIYMMLKHNDIFNVNSSNRFKVTFIPPEDMLHVYFKLDPKTHRGISDLEKALFPAKLYSTLYITNTIASMTRGQDRRVYYVKQTVDTNIASLLLNTINQIKKSNFGIRQVENINHVLNLIGRFNDFVIPRSSSNETPVEFEIMPGQQINPQTELMEELESMAINATDVPLEVIQSRQSIDYAMQLTMSNSKFLRKTYNRQARYQRYLSDICTKLYNAEYEEDTRLVVTLPPPMFLNITNTNQIITNTKDYVNSIWEDDVSDIEDEITKNIYKRKLLQFHLGTYINVAKHQELLDQAKQEAALKKNEVSGDGIGDDMGMGSTGGSDISSGGGTDDFSF